MVLGYDYPILGFFFSVLMIALFVIWLWLLFSVLIDVFRSEDLNGWTKALWVIFVVLMPYLGVLVYLIARGGKMHERAVRGAVKHQQEFDDYVRQTASTGSTADELQKLAGLRDTGVISPEEFETQKAKLLA
jgi:ABC-type multidrug transport system fused ATPase/permease subunit